MDTMKCSFLIFLLVTVPMAGCLEGETSQPIIDLETELNSKNETIQGLQYELEESLSYIEYLQNGWEATNQSLVIAINNADLAQKEILELQMGWQSTNQTLVQFEKEWAAYNSTVNGYLSDWSQANDTISELQNNLQDANQIEYTHSRSSNRLGCYQPNVEKFQSWMEQCKCNHSFIQEWMVRHKSNLG